MCAHLFYWLEFSWLVLLALAVRLLNCRYFFLFSLCVPKGDRGPQAFLANTWHDKSHTENRKLRKVSSFSRTGCSMNHLKALITLEQMITSVVKNKRTIVMLEQNFDGEAIWLGV